MAPTKSPLDPNDQTRQDLERTLNSSQYVEQLRSLGHDLLKENSRLYARIRALEQALEEEKETGMVLKASRETKRRH